ALKALHYTVRHDAANVPAYLLLAKLALNDDRDTDVIAFLGLAIKAAPQDPAPRLALVRYYMGRRRFGEAEPVVAGLLKIAPSNVEGIALLGELEFSLGAKAAAVTTFR